MSGFLPTFPLPMSEFLYEHMFVHICTYACMYYNTFFCVCNIFSHIFRMMYYISFRAKKSNLPRNVKSRKENIEGNREASHQVGKTFLFYLLFKDFSSYDGFSLEWKFCGQIYRPCFWRGQGESHSDPFEHIPEFIEVF